MLRHVGFNVTDRVFIIMMDYKKVSECKNSDWCGGYNEALDDCATEADKWEAAYQLLDEFNEVMETTIEVLQQDINRLNAQIGGYRVQRRLRGEATYNDLKTENVELKNRRD